MASWLGSDQLTTCYKYKAFAQAVQAFDDKKKSQSIDDTGLRLEKGSNLIKKKLKRIVDKACIRSRKCEALSTQIIAKASHDVVTCFFGSLAV